MTPRERARRRPASGGPATTHSASPRSGRRARRCGAPLRPAPSHRSAERRPPARRPGRMDAGMRPRCSRAPSDRRTARSTATFAPGPCAPGRAAPCPTSRCRRAGRCRDSGTKPEMASMKVVLPAPLGPIRPTSWPGSIRRSTSTTAWTPPKLTDNACVSRTGVTQLPSAPQVADCETITRIINNMLNSRVKRCYCRLAVTANIHSWITKDGRVTNVALTHARRT